MRVVVRPGWCDVPSAAAVAGKPARRAAALLFFFHAVDSMTLRTRRNDYGGVLHAVAFKRLTRTPALQSGGCYWSDTRWDMSTSRHNDSERD